MRALGRVRKDLEKLEVDARTLTALWTQPLPQPLDGMLDVPTAPGLGLEVDRAKLARFAVES